MLEEIRVKIMNRLKEKETEVSKWKEIFSPKCIELFIAHKKIAQLCTINFNSDIGYEMSEGEYRHIVNLVEKQCTCRSWRLTGIPYPYAIKAMEYNKIKPNLIKKDISVWYSKKAYLKTYRVKLLPIRGDNFWKILPEHAMDSPDLFAEDEQGARLKRRRDRSEEKEIQDDVHDINSSASQSTQEGHDHFYEPFGPSSEPKSDPYLRLQIVPEDTRLLVRQTPRISAASRSRLVGFRGDLAGVSEPTDLLYLPSKLT
ncbi:hypothetical protein FXO38_15902 [Capsicum annuum]|nr:hypothetical protein FXO38_15902 [Capsicum annuum]KAF3670623.1 hypothetical protein FXO37_08453 [Capsicum annuum]